MKVISANTT